MPMEVAAMVPALRSDRNEHVEWAAHVVAAGAHAGRTARCNETLASRAT